MIPDQALLRPNRPSPRTAATAAARRGLNAAGRSVMKKAKALKFSQRDFSALTDGARAFVRTRKNVALVFIAIVFALSATTAIMGFVLADHIGKVDGVDPATGCSSIFKCESNKNAAVRFMTPAAQSIGRDKKFCPQNATEEGVVVDSFQECASVVLADDSFYGGNPVTQTNVISVILAVVAVWQLLTAAAVWMHDGMKTTVNVRDSSVFLGYMASILLSLFLGWQSLHAVALTGANTAWLWILLLVISVLLAMIFKLFIVKMDQEDDPENKRIRRTVWVVYFGAILCAALTILAATLLVEGSERENLWSDDTLRLTERDLLPDSVMGARNAAYTQLLLPPIVLILYLVFLMVVTRRRLAARHRGNAELASPSVDTSKNDLFHDTLSLTWGAYLMQISVLVCQLVIFAELLMQFGDN